LIKCIQTEKIKENIFMEQRALTTPAEIMGAAITAWVTGYIKISKGY
jgi:hypothetical protein